MKTLPNNYLLSPPPRQTFLLLFPFFNLFFFDLFFSNLLSYTNFTSLVGGLGGRPWWEGDLVTLHRLLPEKAWTMSSVGSPHCLADRAMVGRAEPLFGTPIPELLDRPGGRAPIHTYRRDGPGLRQPHGMSP